MFSSNATQVSSVANYIEDVFSTYLYTGNGSTQTITNGIDLSGEGGLVWNKCRSNAQSHGFWDTVRGATKYLRSDSTGAEATYSGLTSFNADGFSIDSGAEWNQNTYTYASWTFRKQPKFFDVVTWTGTDNNARNISHNLGSAPGCIMLKTTSTTSNWFTYHRSLGYGPTYPNFLYLNTTGSVNSGSGGFFAGDPTSTYFPVGGDLNLTGVTYVAYLFAHNAGGFGLTGTDNVISCGSFTTDGSGNATVSLGYEPQWLLVKRSDNVGNWTMVDIMRGLSVRGFNDSTNKRLYSNTSGAETNSNVAYPTATGFQSDGGLDISATYIYIAIRRGPMKVPTSGTSVFSATTNKPTSGLWGATNLVDFALAKWTSGDQYWSAYDRLRGYNPYLQTNSTNAEANYGNSAAFARNADWYTASLFGANIYSGYFFSRAPNFFDEVCYTGDGENGRSINHNLTVEPELIIAKPRSVLGDWIVYAKNNGVSQNAQAILNGNKSFGWYAGIFPSPYASSTTFQVASSASINDAGQTYVAYLFATCAGVSKVGSYTGTGTTKQVDCGFTGGARFVLIKRTNSTGDWYVWDSARGIVSGNDPYLLLNSTAAEVTNTDYIDTYSAGFEISSTAPAAINASGGTFIFLAIA